MFEANVAPQRASAHTASSACQLRGVAWALSATAAVRVQPFRALGNRDAGVALATHRGQASDFLKRFFGGRRRALGSHSRDRD
ncbi:hypothetical protein F2P45_15665 [Massilia sp. CCM 8733]|uniref:Uncharacterized protein n=1 Tax=Massilia mucilaginosa TaxID=2609282 RepID=A0ABX0NUF0_9BURK|nr:hypothetical protein [Massilia mucilaginosa]NHZ90445.1 hypothetical protein [Massilia mucilaginosa]